jgi:hypothetical protein
VANLGRLEDKDGSQFDALIRGLCRAAGREEPTRLEIAHEPARAYGDVFVLHAVWNDLGFDRALRRALRSGKCRLDVEALVRAMVFNRLCAPDPTRGCLRWLDTVAMPAMPDGVTHQHLLRAMGALMDRADQVERELTRQIRPFVDRDLAFFFYDLTTDRIHGEGTVEDDLRAYGMNKEVGGIARQFILGIVQTAEGLPSTVLLEPMAQPCRLHTVHPGNVAEAKTLQAMLATVLERFPIERVILVADRGLLSLDTIDALADLTTEGGRRLEFILAVPARRHAELVDTFRALAFDDAGLAEASFAGHRPIVAHDPLRAEEQTARRRCRIAEPEAMAEKMVAKPDAQDEGQTARGRRASDRGACRRFCRAVAEAEMSRFIKPDFTADRFSWSVDKDAVVEAQRFDGKLALITNAPELTPADAVIRYPGIGRYRARLPRAEIRRRDRAGPPPPAGAHPRPCADWLSGARPLPRHAPAPEDEGACHQPPHRTRSPRPHPTPSGKDR